MRRFTLAAIVCLPLALSYGLLRPAVAAPPSAAQLPQNAKWMIHIDLQALVQTELAEAARAERPRLTHLMQRWFQAKFGINPHEDLDSLTLFSDSYDEHQGTMILRADYAMDKVRDAFDQNPDVTKEAWEGYTLYTIEPARRNRLRPAEDNGDARRRLLPRRQDNDNTAANRDEVQEAPSERAMTVILVNEKSMVIASSPERAKKAVGLVRGDSPILAEDSPLLAEVEEGALLYGAAIDLQQIEHRAGFFPVLAQHERIYWTIGGSDGELNVKLVLHAHTEDVAEQMEKSLEGSIAFGKVWAADSENLRQVFDNRQLSREGKRVQLTGHAEMETVRAVIGELRERLQQRLQLGNEGAAGRRADSR